MVDKLLGTKLGKYELRRTLGRGGMASVYEGYDSLLNRRVAIKVLSPALSGNSDAVERFRREAVTAANLEHPNIIPIFDVKEENGIHYIAMRYIDGDTLAAVIGREAPVSLPRALELLEPIARALDYAHERGVVHRDIKPANILIDEEGRPTLTDFGIAKAADQAALTNTGEVMGTANYVSPEQLAGQPLNYRSDLYSLAVTLFELLTAHLPFEGSSSQDILYAHLYRAPVPLRTYRPDLPPAIEAIMARALAKDPQHRFTNGQELVDTLKHTSLPVQVPQHPSVSSTPPPAPPLPPPTTHRAIPLSGPVPSAYPPNRAVQHQMTPPGPVRRVSDPSLRSSTPPPRNHQSSPQHPISPTSRSSLFKLVGILVAISLVLGLVLAAVLFFSRTPPPDPVSGSSLTALPSTGYTGPRHNNNGDDLHAFLVKSTPAIDGNLNKWSNIPPVAVANNIPRTKQWGGTKDSSASCYFGYDAQNFYAACLVIDDKHVQDQTGNLIWQGDDVELWFDTDLANHLNTTYNNIDLSPVPHVYQIGLSAGNWSTHKPEAYRWTTVLASGADLGIKVAAQQQGEGYNIEAAIPWSALEGFKPTSGKPIGFAVVLSDDDTPGLTGREAQEKIVSTSPHWYWDSPKDFGNLFFE